VVTLLGHSDAALVTRRYRHALPDELARARRDAERMASNEERVTDARTRA
jgi:hypothetical protein